MKQNFPAQPASIREEERRRLARLLERRLGASLNLLLEQANTYRTARSPSAEGARAAIHALTRMTAQAVTDLHDLMLELKPSDLHDLGLRDALEALALRVERRYGLTVTLDVSPDLSSEPVGGAVALCPELELALYRVAQQAMHNAAEHAGAGRVGLSLRLEHGALRLTVADDGSGFEPPRPLGALVAEEKWGLAEMVEWAEALGGQLEISSVLGIGTQVRARLPLEPVPEPLSMRAVEPLIEPLTPRELDVLAGVAAGLTNKQIAVRLGISDRTVQFHLGNVLGKLSVASRTEAAVLALQRGLV